MSVGVISDRVAAQPDPPQNVRIKFRNGAVIPCEVRYMGYQQWAGDGRFSHGWRVLNEGPFDYREGDQLFVGYFPPGNHYVQVAGTGPIERWATPTQKEQPQ